jgi:serine/threonine-protein kinase
VDDSRVGSLLGGRYRLLRKLGEGGMGTVYVGLQEPLGRKVAVKVLLPVLARDATLVARFQREAELAASLGHPNIVQVTDFGVEDGAAFLVMDLLEGESLGAVIEREAPLTSERVRFIATQILSALEAAHARGVVHRDLKPDNVFLTSVSGVADLVKLLDFGIARLVEDADQKMTATGQVLGTPAYMSPEQARGRPVDARSDLYAVGVVMYEALSGGMPVSGSNYHELMFAIVDQIPTPLTDLVSGLDPELVAVVNRAMHKEANARYASAAEMRAALDALGPLSARSPSRVPSRPPPTRVNGEVAMAATVTPEALSAVTASESARPAAIQPSVAITPRSRRWWPWLALGLTAAAAFAGFVLVRSSGSDATPNAAAELEAAAEARALAIVERVMHETSERLEATGANDGAALDAPEAVDMAAGSAPREGRVTEPSTGSGEATEEGSDGSGDEGERDCRAIVEDETPLRVRAEPSVRAAIRAELPTGARVEVLERRGEAWGRIAAPAEGWIWMEKVREPCPPDRPAPRPRLATSAPVRCGDLVQDTPIVRGGDQIVVAMRRTNNLVPMDAFRDLTYSWGPALTRCYQGKPSVGGPFTLRVDAAGRVTEVSRNPYCEAPRGLESCVRDVVLGAEVGNATGGAGEVQFDVSHRRPR